MSKRREMLAAVRDLQPVRTTVLADALGRVPQSLSQSLALARNHGLVERTQAGWVVTPVGAGAVADLVPRDWGRDAGLRWGFQERALAALGSDALTTTQVGELLEADRSLVHRTLKRLEEVGFVLRVPGRPVRWRRVPNP